MPGIGDYVHLNAASFKEHGITKNAGNVVQYQHSKMYSTAVNRGKPSLSNPQVKALENLFNQKSIINKHGKDVVPAIHKNVMKTLQKDCLAIMLEWFDDDSQWEINSNGEVVQKKALSSDKSQKIYKINDNIQIKNVKKRMEQLESLLKDVFTKIEKKDLPDAVQKFITAQGSLDNIIATVTRIKNSLDTQLKGIDLKTKFGEVSKENNNLLEGINYINSVIEAFCACPPISYIEGAYREIFVKTFTRTLSGQIENNLIPELGWSVVEGISSAEVVGSQQASLNLLDANFAFTKSGQGSTEKSFKDIFQDELGRKVKLEGYSSTSKADVIIEWEDGTSTGISVKNYHIDEGMGKYVSLVDGTSIFVLMSNWNPRFATTFLNLYSTHPDDKKVDLTTERIRIAREVIYTIIYQSLSGDVFGRDKSHLADVFLFYNPSTQKYKIIQISTLLQHLQALGAYTTPMSIKISGQSKGITAFMRDGGNPWKFKNTSVGDATLNANDMDARERIIRLLADSHNKKLHVSLKLNSSGGIVGPAS